MYWWCWVTASSVEFSAEALWTICVGPNITVTVLLWRHTPSTSSFVFIFDCQPPIKPERISVSTSLRLDAHSVCDCIRECFRLHSFSDAINTDFNLIVFLTYSLTELRAGLLTLLFYCGQTVLARGLYWDWWILKGNYWVTIWGRFTNVVWAELCYINYFQIIAAHHSVYFPVSCSTNTLPSCFHSLWLSTQKPCPLKWWQITRRAFWHLPSS